VGKVRDDMMINIFLPCSFIPRIELMRIEDKNESIPNLYLFVHSFNQIITIFFVVSIIIIVIIIYTVNVT